MNNDESEKIDRLIVLSQKFRAYGPNEHAADPEMMLKLSALYLQDAAERMNHIAKR